MLGAALIIPPSGVTGRGAGEGRVLKLYTRKGDGGWTSLFDGTSVRKDDPRLEACGSLDELNAAVGLVIAGGTDVVLSQRLREVQADLFVIGADLAAPPGSPARGKLPSLGAERVAQLEAWIDEACAGLPPLNAFIHPGGTETASRLHLARAICRRAERAVVSALHHGLADKQAHGSAESSAEEPPDGANDLAYLNRLGDLLFAWARLANWRRGLADTAWVRPVSGGGPQAEES